MKRAWSLLLLSPPAAAATIAVPDDAPTVQAGLSLAQPCDEVVVAAGVWTGVFDVPRGVTLRGVGPSTILDGEGAEEIVLLTQGSRLTDVAVRNGRYAVRPHGAWSEVADVTISDAETGLHAWSSTFWAHDVTISGAVGSAVLVDGGEAWLDDIMIDGAMTGFDVTNTVGRILRASVSGAHRAVVLRNTGIVLREATITGGGVGVLVHGGSATLEGNTLTGMEAGIHLIDANTVVLGNSVSSVEYGIRTDYSLATIVANTITNAVVVGLAEGFGSGSLVAGNVVKDSGTGLVVDLADTHAWNNAFVRNTLGAWLHGGAADLRNSVFLDGETGVDATTAPSALVAYCAFQGNSVDAHGVDLNDGTHWTGVDLGLDDVRGAPLPGSPLLDAGDPSTPFDDPDGTPNDIGPDGGPEGDAAYFAPTPTAPELGEQPEALGVEGEWIVAFAMNVHDSDGDPRELLWDSNPQDGLQFCDDWGNALSFFPEDDGVWEVALRVRGPGGAFDDATVTIRADNQLPELRVEPLGSAAEGRPLALFVDAWDPGPADTLTWMLDVDGDGATDLSGPAPGVAEWTPPESGPLTLRLTVADDDGGFVEQEVALTVANLPPELRSPLPTLAIVGELLEYPLSYSDPSTLDAVTASLLDGPDGMTLEDGVLRWTPAEAGTFDLLLRLVDSEGATIEPTGRIEAIALARPEGCACGTSRGGSSVGLVSLLLLAARRRSPSSGSRMETNVG